MKIPFLSLPSLKRIKSNAAETLAEVLIALIVISVGAGGALTLVVTSMRANQEAEERLVGYNLAREGVEAMRTIRDTNWLRFPSDRENCWDVEPGVTDPGDCSTWTKIGDVTSYIVYQEADPDDQYSLLTWKLEDATTLVDEYQIIYAYHVRYGTIYTHEFGCPSGGDICDEATIYSRLVTIPYVDANSIEVNSTVTWESRGQSKSITFSDLLTNY
ncbi:hypothetical protein HN748_04415 [Candidatus Peregrinibacteria bacterium]|jgi:Tfp pilus assembly protein PilV|nr:hypothetical protein [Candidatus Peregrinibacteria bacterium]MBT7484015.1 hypothetical protein [Candidatus Peregrinibacteria bacterium]MBT7703454.1 hypothetical protein [Candidatus Peregrinibacteria bacterium]